MTDDNRTQSASLHCTRIKQKQNSISG